MLKGVQLANEMKMMCIGTCAKSGLYMDKLLENVVRPHSSYTVKNEELW